MLNRVLTVAQILALIGIPIILLIISSHVTSKIKNAELSLEYVKLAIQILKNPSRPEYHANGNHDTLRIWAEEIFQRHSPIPIKQELRDKLRSGETSLPSADVVFEQNIGKAKVILRRAASKPLEAGVKQYDLEGDDLFLQKERVKYLSSVTHILNDESVLTHAHAVALWLAGIDLHNKSLEHDEWNSDNLDEHLKEFDLVYSTLVDIVAKLDNIDSDLQAQMLSYLDIHSHNYNSHLRHIVSFREKQKQ